MNEVYADLSIVCEDERNSIYLNVIATVKFVDISQLLLLENDEDPYGALVEYIDLWLRNQPGREHCFVAGSIRRISTVSRELPRSMKVDIDATSIELYLTESESYESTDESITYDSTDTE